MATNFYRIRVHLESRCQSDFCSSRPRAVCHPARNDELILAIGSHKSKGSLQAELNEAGATLLPIWPLYDSICFHWLR